MSLATWSRRHDAAAREAAQEHAFSVVCGSVRTLPPSQGIKVWRGHELAFPQPRLADRHESYDWKKLDANSAET